MKIDIQTDSINDLNKIIDYKGRVNRVFELLPEYEDALSIEGLEEVAEEINNVHQGIDDINNKHIPYLLKIILDPEKEKEEIELIIGEKYKQVIDAEKNLNSLTCKTRIFELEDHLHFSSHKDADIFTSIEKIKKEKLKLDKENFTSIDDIENGYRQVLDECEEIENRLIGMDQQQKTADRKDLRNVIIGVVITAIIFIALNYFGLL